MKVLVDTSVWIEHLKKPVPELVELLTERRVLTHPVVIGELACGTFRKRHEILGNLKILPKAQTASHEEALELIEARKLYGKGVGFSDTLILASALVSEATIFSFDRAMKSVATQLGIRAGLST
jgi:predicted nucleic acid-binding protein